jgi:hypothetical protein
MKTMLEESQYFIINNSNIYDTPMLFKKKSKKIIIKPLSYIRSDTGKTRHFTPGAQEWYNSIYSYNLNYLKCLSITDKNLMYLLKGYFNLQMNYKLVKNHTKPLTNRYKRLTTKRVFVGRGDLKHTGNKVIITCYTYNAEGMFLSTNFNKLSQGLFNPKKRILFSPKRDRIGKVVVDSNDERVMLATRQYTQLEYLSLPDHYEWYLSSILSILDKINLMGVYSNSLSNLVEKKVLNLDDKLIIYYDKIKNIKTINYPDFNTYMEISNNEYIKIWEMYKILLYYNKIKFTKIFSEKLLAFVKAMYNKNIEFNVVNLKKIHLNSDIFTQIISLKLRNRDNKLYKVLLASFRKTNIPLVSKIAERISKPNKDEFIVNKIRNNLITSMFTDNNSKDPLNNLILNYFPYVNNLETIKIKRRSINIRPISLKNYVLRSLKHLKLRGIRLEAKGRLTRRFTAARSVSKLRWKGGLKNVESSFRGLSTILLRGFAKSNVQYSLISSKNRNGAYGVKCWIGSK